MANKTILIGVNDVFFYTKLRDALRPQGYSLEKARTHGEVADKAHALRPAAVVLNINDEGLDAFKALEALKSDAQSKSIPVLAFVNHEEVDNWKRAQQLGVTKVVSRNEFSSRTLQLVQEVVGTGGAPRVPVAPPNATGDGPPPASSSTGGVISA
jgi:PleD family two-component response regulator